MRRRHTFLLPPQARVHFNLPTAVLVCPHQYIALARLLTMSSCAPPSVPPPSPRSVSHSSHRRPCPSTPPLPPSCDASKIMQDAPLLRVPLFLCGKPELIPVILHLSAARASLLPAARISGEPACVEGMTVNPSTPAGLFRPVISSRRISTLPPKLRGAGDGIFAGSGRVECVDFVRPCAHGPRRRGWGEGKFSRCRRREVVHRRAGCQGSQESPERDGSDIYMSGVLSSLLAAAADLGLRKSYI